MKKIFHGLSVIVLVLMFIGCVTFDYKSFEIKEKIDPRLPLSLQIDEESYALLFSGYINKNFEIYIKGYTFDTETIEFSDSNKSDFLDYYNLLSEYHKNPKDGFAIIYFGDFMNEFSKKLSKVNSFQKKKELINDANSKKILTSLTVDKDSTGENSYKFEIATNFTRAPLYNTTKQWLRFSYDQLDRNIISKNEDPIGLLQVELSQCDEYYNTGELLGYLIPSALTGFIINTAGFPFRNQRAKITISATVLDNFGNEINSFTVDGKGTGWVAAYWGYSVFGNPFNSDQKAATAQAFQNAFDGLIKRLEDDSKMIREQCNRSNETNTNMSVSAPTLETEVVGKWYVPIDLLRYDGFYYCETNNLNKYMKFHSTGIVGTCNSRLTPDQFSDVLKSETKNKVRWAWSDYGTIGNEVRFITKSYLPQTSYYMEVSCNGEIKSEAITLNGEYQATGTKFSLPYQFHKFDH